MHTTFLFIRTCYLRTGKDASNLIIVLSDQIYEVLLELSQNNLDQENFVISK